MNNNTKLNNEIKINNFVNSEYHCAECESIDNSFLNDSLTNINTVNIQNIDSNHIIIKTNKKCNYSTVNSSFNKKKTNNLNPINRPSSNKNVNSNSNSNINNIQVNTNNRHLKIPDRISKQLNIIKGETAINAKDSAEYLKISLQEANQLEPDKPIITRHEKDMLKKIIKQNPYLNSLFQSVLASMKVPNSSIISLNINIDSF